LAQRWRPHKPSLSPAAASPKKLKSEAPFMKRLSIFVYGIVCYDVFFATILSTPGLAAARW
jgi:hypothetical protein